MTNNDEVKLPKLVDDLPLNAPHRLDTLSITYLSNNLSVLFKELKVSKIKFHQGIYLPSILTDALFSYLLLHSSLATETILKAFSDPSKCCLQKCQLNNVSIKTSSLYRLCSMQNIQVLELFNVTFKGETCDISQLLESCGSKLRSFQIYNLQNDNSGYNLYCLDKSFHPCLKSIKLSGGAHAWYFLVNDRRPIPLVSLELNNVVAFDELAFVEEPLWQKEHQFGDRLNILTTSNALRQAKAALDSCKCEGSPDYSEVPKHESAMDQMEDEMSHPSFKRLLMHRYRLDVVKHTLLSLTLFNTNIEEDDFNLIFKLKKLQHLDISCSNAYDTQRFMVRPSVYSVWNIIENLPDLVSLDLSNTAIGDQLYIDGKLKDITGERRLSRPVARKLVFLGLSESEGCELVDIHSLADEVSGYCNENQIMTALHHYRHRPSMLTISYNHLYPILRHQSIICPHKLLKSLIESVHNFPLDNDLSLTCTANLFFLTRQHYSCYTTQERRDVIMCLMKYLQKQSSNKLVVRNVMLTLFHFEIPLDFVFRFDLVIKVILNILVTHQDQPDVNTLVINFCNTLVCSTKYDMKSEVAHHDFVPTIMSVIKRRLLRNICDEVMLVAWSTLWNVTDETPLNSETFISEGGLRLLEDCFDRFSRDVEIHKNMMGLVGNITEVKHLRPHLMKTNLVPLFHRLLIEEDQNLEVAYNVSGTLSHILSDGPEAWTYAEPHRDVVRRDMYDVIQKWDVTSSRSINYRSFLPILGLIECDVPECIHWAVWALCNLSQVDNKYCKLLLDENGIEILKTVEKKEVEEETKRFARDVVRRVENDQSLLL